MGKIAPRWISVYWVCQLTGWLGMVFIEMINYTFFIVRRFDTSILYLFLACAVVGILLTHGYRYWLKRRNWFSANRFQIWLLAFLSTLVISTLLMAATEFPLMWMSNRPWSSLRFVDVAGMIMNWMRYVGVWIIIYFMYHLLQQNASIRHEKLAVEHLAKSTELELLRSQLNPHFLFNALNAIKALVSIDPEIARDAIVKLSELLRYTLNYGRREKVTLQEEIQEVAKYLELEQLRFEERLRIEWDIPVSIHQGLIPPALLLTLAENAVKHGIALHHTDGLIRLEGSLVGRNMILRVWNSGSFQVGEHTGIGLVQVRERLKSIYGSQAFFSIGNGNGMVSAELIIPIK
jgi:sensor histidine kinase YesM